MLAVGPNGLTTRVKTPTIHELDRKIDQCRMRRIRAIKKAQDMKGLETHATH